MATEFAGRIKSPVATFVGTTVWPFSGVRPHVLSKATQLVELPPTPFEIACQFRTLLVDVHVRDDARVGVILFVTPRMCAAENEINTNIFRSTRKIEY